MNLAKKFARQFRLTLVEGTTIKTYRDFVLSADVVERGPDGLVRSFDVRVFASPAGEGAPLRRELPDDLGKALGRLDRRKLDLPGIIGLGEVLADLILPTGPREMLVRSLERLDAGEGLRLRLRLPPELAGLPWEYLYIQRAHGEKDATGFLALDPRLSIARHEALAVAADVDDSPRPRRLIAALSSPTAEGWAPLDLGKERAVIEAATAGVPNLAVDVLPEVTAEGLLDALVAGADVFHFAGHGVFEQTGLGARPGALTGQGSLVLMNAAGGPAPMAADQLAVNLRGRGVQVVVLGACETGKRDEEQAWSGVAAALMEAGIPAVVAMQFRVWDDAAIAFARALYGALAAGLSLDEAVSLGRLQVFNLVHPRRDGFWREWGVPVLYLRAGGDITLSTITDPAARAAAAESARVVAELRVKEIGPGAVYIGVEAGALLGGSVESFLGAGSIAGEATLVDAETMTGGDVTSRAEVDRIEQGGRLTGVRLGQLGGAAPAAAGQPGSAAGSPAAPVAAAASSATSPAPPPSDPAAPPSGAAPAGAACTGCSAELPGGAKFCPTCGTPVPAGPRFCSQCGAKLGDGARFCGECGTAAG
jgi:hypothetical protein